MYDIQELEQRWKRYRRKRWIRYTLIGALGLAILSMPVGYWVYHSSETHSASKGIIANGKTAERKNAAEGPRHSEPHAPQTAPSATALAPVPPETTRQSSVSTATQSEPTHKHKGMIITFTDGSPASHSRRTTIETDPRVIHDLEKRFPLSKDYADAIFLARYYYTHRQYAKARYWAMQANGVDPSRPQSWIVFAKALVHEGKRVEALKALQAYYDKTGDATIKRLIDTIRKGKRVD